MRFELVELDGRLALRDTARPDFLPLTIDWTSTEQRRRIAGGKQQLLARAIGLHRRRVEHVVDATAGLGRDAMTLAALGVRVTLIERCAELFALLTDARERACRSPHAVIAAAAQRMTLIHDDALRWLPPRGRSADVVHLDPMYPDDGRRALPQKGMQMIADLAGPDDDADALFDAARRARVPRIVVKRPVGGRPLGGQAPDASVAGKQARYDIYLGSTRDVVQAPISR